MKIWTFTDVQPDEDLIRTSIHGTKENAMDALRAYIVANDEDYTDVGELENYTYTELEEIVPSDVLVSIDEHDLGPDIGPISSRDVLDMS